MWIGYSLSVWMENTLHTYLQKHWQNPHLNLILSNLNRCKKILCKCVLCACKAACITLTCIYNILGIFVHGDFTRATGE